MKWQDPPPVKHGVRGIPVPPWYNQLKTRPGEWAIVEENIFPSQAYYMRDKLLGRKKSFIQPGEMFEARTVTLDNGCMDLYAKFIGTDPEPI